MALKTEKLRMFLAANPDITDFRNESLLLVRARDFCGYHKRTDLSYIADSLQRELANMNNNGDTKEPLTVEAILRRGRYNFNSIIIQRVLGQDGYKDFVTKYIEGMDRSRGHIYAPDQGDIQIFDLFDAGKISLEEAGESFGLKIKTRITERLGRIYAYKKQQENASRNLQRKESSNNQQSVSNYQA